MMLNVWNMKINTTQALPSNLIMEDSPINGPFRYNAESALTAVSRECSVITEEGLPVQAGSLGRLPMNLVLVEQFTTPQFGI